MGPIVEGYRGDAVRREGKRAVDIKVRAVGMIANPDYAGRDRGKRQVRHGGHGARHARQPALGWHAAERHGIKVEYPPSYARSRFDQWPGSKLARPQCRTNRRSARLP